MKLVVTSGDHNAFLLDAQKDSTLTQLNAFKAHSCSVKTASFRPQSAGEFIEYTLTCFRFVEA